MVQIVFLWHLWSTIQWKYLWCCQHIITSKCDQGHGGGGSDPLYGLEAIQLYKWHWRWVSDPPACLNTRNHTSTALNIIASVLTLLNTPRVIGVEFLTHSIAFIPFYDINGIVGASCYIWTSFYSQICRTASFPFSYPSHRSPCTIRSGAVSICDTIWCCLHVRYNLVLSLCMIQSGAVFMYDINLRATHTTILSTRGVKIPIYLVSSTTDSIRQRVVLFKPVWIPTSDPKSEFLCQSSYWLRRTCRLPWTPHTPGKSPTPLSPRITHTATVLVLWQSTWSRSSTCRELNNLVAATQLKSSRTFHLNVTHHKPIPLFEDHVVV